MRNISFSLTEEQFVDGSKDVTRRRGWAFLKPGDRLMACRKCMGLKRGEKIVHLGEIEVVSVRREKLYEMARIGEISSKRIGYGKTEAIREGFPHLSGDQFVTMFCNHMGGRPDQIITRIEFRRIPNKPCAVCGKPMIRVHASDFVGFACMSTMLCTYKESFQEKR